MIHFVVEGKAIDVGYLDFIKAFDSVSHSVLLRKLPACGLDRYTLGSVKNCMDGQAHCVVVNGLKTSWHLVASSGLCLIDYMN